MRLSVAGLVLGLSVASPLLAAGTQSAPAPEVPALTPEEQAVNEYNAGLGYRDKALEADAKVEAETDEKKRAKLEAKRTSLFEKAAKRYQSAIKLNAGFVEAHGSLGYALRRLGRFEEAMTAYDTALGLNPNYPEAIEYRAEALLGLHRVAEAQEAYERLTAVHPTYAAKLLSAMKSWAAVESNSAAVAEAGLSDWIADRERVSGATSSGGQSGGPRSWR